ncbi:MAG: hypothetical protein ACHQF3_07360, partial [Alphaproteobacteria bacterium]
MAAPCARRRLAAEAEAALASTGLRARCRVRVIDERRLARARSIEDILAAFRHDRVIYDPTRAISRAKAVQRCAARLAGAFGDMLRGAYLEPRSRTLYLVFSPDKLLDGGRLDGVTRAAIEARTARVLANWQAGDGDAFELAVRLGISAPDVPVIAIDRASHRARRPRRWLRRLRGGGIAGSIAALFGAGLAGPALADGPAVSELNGKVSAEGGAGEGSPLGYLSGSGTLPVGDSFGAQLDAALGKSGRGTLWGVAGQGFWRDPAQGLLGGFAVHVTRDGLTLNRFGAEGEAYLDQFTVSGAAGYQDGRVGHGGFARAKLAWYPIDDLKFTIGAEYNPVRPLGLAGVEYQLGLSALPGLAVFADGGVSGRGAEFGLLGVRYYFGTTKSLIRRHREDDPPNAIE